MARRRRVKKNVFKTFIILLLTIALSLIGYSYFKDNNKIDNNIDDHNNQNNILEEAWPKEYKIDLLATGDTVIHNSLYLYAEKEDGSYDFSNYLTEINDIVSQYDIAYYNQETILGSSELGFSGYPQFNSPTEFGDAMLDAGFNTVSLATNHSYDRREKGVLSSLNYWKNTDAMYNGMADSEESRTNYMIKTVNNISYALLSYTYSTNGITVPSDKSYLVNVYNDELAKKDIEALRDKVDVLIVAMHWGNEYTFTPTETQKSQAKFLADLGVDIVIGNHPHCIQPIEWIDDTLIIYALGNFISNQGILYDSIGYKGVIGAFATMDITKTVNKDQSQDVKISNLNIELLYTYKNTTKKYYKVVPFSKMNNSYLNNYLEVYDKYKEVFQRFDKTINVLPAAS